MSMRITVHGDKIDLADELRTEFHADAKDAVEVAAGIVLLEVDRLLTLRRGTPQTAAPEGEPPEADTTALIRSFRVMNGRVKGNVAWSGIQSNDPAVARLEFGATDVRGIRTFPHPFILPAFATSRDEMDGVLRARLT